MKRKIITVSIAVFFFLAAIGITLYPVISNAYNAKHHSDLLYGYINEISKADDTALVQAKEDAALYNQTLASGMQTEDPFSKESLQEALGDYLGLLSMNGSGIIGYIEIPSIDVHLPIYHGTNDTVLQKGIGHLLGSSLPIGGESTHTILTGHSGMASQRMFTDLPLLDIGEVFYLHILDDVLAYQIFGTDEVLPHNTAKLQIERGKDLCTLITCTPIGVNTHRLLVMAKRIPYEKAEEIVDTQPMDAEQESAWGQNYKKGIIIGAAIAVTIALLALAIRLFRRCHNLKIRIAIFAVMILFFLAGCAVLLYPSIHGTLVDKQIRAEADSFLDKVSEDIPKPMKPVETEPSLETAPDTTEGTMEHADLWNAMNAYNQSLWEDKQSGLCDPWSYTQPAFTLGEYGLEDEVFGVITIPAIGLSMPIYLGATDIHLANGAAQLSQTSLPIGGINTNCVLAGHRGWNGASYFRYVPDLKIGDEVIITNLWEKLTYKVVGCDIIAPHDVKKVFIQEGEDMVSLLTCHPYASGGKQRYVVYCEREP